MQNNQILQNPEIAQTLDLEENNPELEAYSLKSPAQQSLPIYEPKDWRSRIMKVWKNLTYWVRRREEILEMMPFWRTEAPAFAITSSILINTGILLLNIVNFGKFPPQVRLFYDHSASQPILVDKSLLLVAPILILLLEIILMRLIYDLFKLDRQLSQTASWLLTAVNIMILIAATQIYQLSL